MVMSAKDAHRKKQGPTQVTEIKDMAVRAIEQKLYPRYMDEPNSSFQRHSPMYKPAKMETRQMWEVVFPKNASYMYTDLRTFIKCGSKSFELHGVVFRGSDKTKGDEYSLVHYTDDGHTPGVVRLFTDQRGDKQTLLRMFVDPRLFTAEDPKTLFYGDEVGEDNDYDFD